SLQSLDCDPGWLRRFVLSAINSGCWKKRNNNNGHCGEFEPIVCYCLLLTQLELSQPPSSIVAHGQQIFHRLINPHPGKPHPALDLTSINNSDHNRGGNRCLPLAIERHHPTFTPKKRKRGKRDPTP
ncbi:MAG: hypothetical protein Q9212_006916, partial [Teloschistes hypoglaucus]